MPRNPYAPPPMLPRPWLPLAPGTLVGTPPGVPAPNPFGVNWPKSQFANPSFVGSTVRFQPVKPIPVAERKSTGPEHWPWAQLGPATPAQAAALGGFDAIPLATRTVGLGLVVLAGFVWYANSHWAPERG